MDRGLSEVCPTPHPSFVPPGGSGWPMSVHHPSCGSVFGSLGRRLLAALLPNPHIPSSSSLILAIPPRPRLSPSPPLPPRPHLRRGSSFQVRHTSEPEQPPAPHPSSLRPSTSVSDSSAGIKTISPSQQPLPSNRVLPRHLQRLVPINLRFRSSLIRLTYNELPCPAVVALSACRPR